MWKKQKRGVWIEKGECSVETGKYLMEGEKYFRRYLTNEDSVL